MNKPYWADCAEAAQIEKARIQNLEQARRRGWLPSPTPMSGLGLEWTMSFEQYQLVRDAPGWFREMRRQLTG